MIYKICDSTDSLEYYIYDSKVDIIRFHLPHIQYIKQLACICFGEQCIDQYMLYYINNHIHSFLFEI